MESLFIMCNVIAFIGWLLLIFAPKWKWSARFISSCLIPVLLAISYGLLLIFSGSSEGGFLSLQDIALLFKNPYILFAGWIHYLAFDLFIGCWEIRDAQHLGISHFLIIPCLILTCMYGPIGLLMYFILRWSKKEFIIE